MESFLKHFETPLANLLLRFLSLFIKNATEFKRAFIFPFTEDKFCWNGPELKKAVLPAANGHFTARSLAKMYAALSMGGTIDGVSLVSAETVEKMQQVQNRGSDQVLFVPMHWRMGYHRVFTAGMPLKNAFGHFGFGGSGAWCDPDRELSVAMTVNTGVGSPMGDSRMPILSSAAVKCADRVTKYAATSSKNKSQLST